MPNSTRRGGEYVYDALVDAGIELLVGIPGTQTLPLDRIVVEREEMRYVMARHETAIPHIAWGYYEASGQPAATLTVPGPGDTNAMHGLKNALEDSVPIVHVSADVDPDDRGKKPIHEIEPETYDTVVKENVVVETVTDLPATVARGIEKALTPPLGPVRLGVPASVLTAEFAAPTATMTPEGIERENDEVYDRVATVLEEANRPVIYAGGGARRSPDGASVVRSLAQSLNAPVLTSYKGKGTFPEDDPRFLGVTGSHLPTGARRALEAADVVLALGTDFDGVTTANWELPMGERLVHVTLDPAAVDVSYESHIAVIDDVGAAGRHLLECLDERAAVDEQNQSGRWDGAAVASAVREEYDAHLEREGLLSEGPPLHTPAVLRAIRRATPDEAVVTTDVGGFRLWAMQVFEAYDVRDFIAAGSWAGMGVGLPAAIGAALADRDAPVVCLSGDGGLLMCIHELHTAAEYDLDVVLVVSNNSDYGVISKSPKISEYTDEHAFRWNSPSYTTIAEGFDWNATAVDSVPALEDALEEALSNGGQTLIDVDILTDEPSAAASASYRSDLSF